MMPTNIMNLKQFRIPRLEIQRLDFGGRKPLPKFLTPEEKRRKFLDDIGITGIAGTEGMGKSLMMTRIGHEFHKLGGEVLALPGYALKDKAGNVVSREVKVEEWIQLPEWLHDKLLLADEIEDHFNSQAWQSILVRLFTGGIFGQRRKRHMGLVYTLQFFEELPKLMRKKTHYVIECKDASIYNPYRVADNKRPLVGGEMTYTTIIDNFGKKPPFIPGYRHNGPMFRNKEMFDLYENEEITDVFSQFTKIEINRKVVKIDLNNDGVITEQEGIESQRLYDVAKAGLVHAFEKGSLKGNAYWRAAHLEMRNPIHQKIAAQLNEELGVEKTTSGTYKRDFALINA